MFTYTHYKPYRDVTPLHSTLEYLIDRDYKIFEGVELVHIEENITDARLYEILKQDFGITWQFEK